MSAHIALRRRWVRTGSLPLVLVVLSLALYLPTVSTERVVTDSQAAAASAWRIATTGAPWMDGVSTRDLEGSRYPDMWIVEGSDGRLVHNRTAGVVLAGVPFYWVLNNDPVADEFRVSVGGVAATTLTAAAGLLIFFGLRALVGDVLAFGGAAALLFTTPVWSVSADALWTHNVTILAIAGATWAAASGRWWSVGACLALGIFARPHLAVIAAVVGIYLGWRRRDWRIPVRIGMTSAVGLALLMAWNRTIFGAWNVRGGYAEYVTDNLVATSRDSLIYSLANVIGFLFAPDRGLLIWTPVILLLLPSLMASWRSTPDWTRALVLGGIAYSVLQLRINSFQGGQNFYGYRVALELLVCLTPALVYAYRDTARPTRLVIGFVLGVQFVAIAIGAAAESYYVTDGDMWTTNAYLVALGDKPLPFGALTVAGAIGGILIAWSLLRTRAHADHSPDSVEGSR